MIWKDIKAFEGVYKVSDTGLIYSVRRKKLIKPESAKGYAQVTLQHKGFRARYKVHRLVAEAFLPNLQNYPCINHIDENKMNNKASNLEWCTIAYNNSYGSRTERSSETQINNAPKIGKTKRVMCVDTGVVYLSTKDAERCTGAYHSHISRCCNGKAKTAGGMRWEYA